MKLTDAQKKTILKALYTIEYDYKEDCYDELTKMIYDLISIIGNPDDLFKECQ